jgi:microsomal epoxide hydrolase
MTTRPWTVEVSDKTLVDLRRRLQQTRWPDPVPSSGWRYGVDIAYLRELCRTWREDYDWRAHEARINAFPQLRCEVDGVDLHVIHVRGKGPRPLPLLLLHGWPGSVAEFLAVLGPLTDPAAHGGHERDAFDIVAPALPGFGFSAAPREPGWGPERIAKALSALMTNGLGYESYGVQGGDWGAIVGSRLAARHPEQVTGLHLNLAPVTSPSEAQDETEVEAMARARARDRDQTGYSHVQRTRPDALTVAQTDSPAGLAAWVVEKFHAWTDHDGDLESAVSRDALLTNLMFYWAPSSAASAARIYREALLERPSTAASRVEVPTGVAAFPREPWRVPRTWVEPRYAVTHWTDMPRGGHFPALEQPQLLVQDVRLFFRDLRSQP